MELDKTKLTQMLNVALEAAKIAGSQALLAIDTVDISIKNGNEMVTQMDLTCQKLIIEHIKKSFPDDGIIGEEGDKGEILKQNPKNGSNIWWVIDPIDGTNNYAHKIMDFTVSIAAMSGGEPVVGVIYAPATNLAFTAIKGDRARLNSKPITVSNEGLTKFSHIAVGSHFSKDYQANIIKLLEKVKFRNFGSTALHLAYVASGSLICSLSNKAKLWDIAAGAVLIETAGGKVTDWQGNPIFPIEMASCNKENYRIIASNKITHSEIRNLLRK